MRSGWLGAIVVAAVLGSAACGAFSTGKEFPSPKRDTLRNGETTRAELEKTFGPPTQVGVENGDESWTWYYFKKGNPDLSKQLQVTARLADCNTELVRIDQPIKIAARLELFIGNPQQVSILTEQHPRTKASSR